MYNQEHITKDGIAGPDRQYGPPTAVSVNHYGNFSTLTSGFDFLLVFSIVFLALKCTVVELEAWNRQTDGRIAACR